MNANLKEHQPAPSVSKTKGTEAPKSKPVGVRKKRRKGCWQHWVQVMRLPEVQ